MPDKKLTDNEIVKALECCINGHCDDGCPFRETREHCHNLDSLILDLINRQKAENERLKKENHWFADIGKLYSEIKAEAYKEFAELVHCHCQNIINQEWNKKVSPVSWSDAYVQFDDEVDNLLKELVGE